MTSPHGCRRIVLRSGKASPVLVVLLSMILVVLLAIVVLMLLPNDGDAVRQLSEPVREIDTTRIEQTYLPGRRYRSVIQATLNARGTSKDWGIETVTNLHYMGEAVTTRLVEQNDGKTLVFLVEFNDARSLAVSTRIDGIRLSPPPLLQLGLEGANLLAILTGTSSLPPGWTTVSVAQANRVMNNPMVLNLLNEASKDRQATFFRFMDDIEGKQVRVTYVNGVGVTKLEAIDSQLTREEEDFIRNLAFLSDSHIFPDLTSEPGQQWLVRGEDLLSVLDPTLRATPRGIITLRRGSDEGTPPQARLEIQDGTLDLQEVSSVDETKARWAPRGHLLFDFRSKIVTYAALTGEFSVEQYSTDHILFEARYSVRPEYEVKYWGELLP